MKKLIFTLLVSTLANAYTSINVINDSSCDLIKQKSYVENGVTFQSTPKDIPSHKSSPILVNFNHKESGEDEYLAGVSYQIRCGNSYDGYVDLEFAPFAEDVTISSSHITIRESDLSLSKIVFIDK